MKLKKKCQRPDILINKYIKQNGEKTSQNDWYKVRGRTIITDGDKYEETREVHWYQAKDVGKVDFKFPSKKTEVIVCMNI